MTGPSASSWTPNASSERCQRLKPPGNSAYTEEWLDRRPMECYGGRRPLDRAVAKRDNGPWMVRQMTHPRAQLSAAVCLLGLLSAVPTVHAQYAPGMDGHALDANTRVGGGGVNTPAQYGSFNTAGLYVTGNVTAGRSFQGYSPIRDASSMFLALPTARSDSFRRDSTGLGNVIVGRSPGMATPYFAPSTTVTNAGVIGAGLNMPGASVPRNTFLIPNASRIDNAARVPLDLTVGARPPDTAVPNSSLYTSENMSLLRQLGGYDRLRLTSQTAALQQSPVFGQSVSRTHSLLPTEGHTGPTLHDPYALPTGLALRPGADPYQRQTRLQDGSPLTPGSEEMLAASRDRLSPTAIAPRLFEQQLTERPRDPLTGRPLPATPSYLADGTRAEDGLSAHDTVSRLASAMARPTGAAEEQPVFGAFPASTDAHPLLELSAAVTWLTEVEADAELRDEVLAVPALNEQYERALALVQGASARSLDTLTGGMPSRVGEHIARAEQAIHEGDYYRASSIYDLAASADPDNSLVRLGHAHSLIAAGEYLTAVVELTRAIDRYAAFGYLNLDLNRLIPDPDMLDIRRADLERRLDMREDHRLRFLLGYIEYYSGLKKFGLPNLRKAAEAAPPGSVIAQVPGMLQHPQPVEGEQGESDQPR